MTTIHGHTKAVFFLLHFAPNVLAQIDSGHFVAVSFSTVEFMSESH
ncbi:hypothetical protein [Paenibacillus sp. Soil766]|nr:hypothetical protein [Paenibacillus sp. Soil766]